MEKYLVKGITGAAGITSTNGSLSLDVPWYFAGFKLHLSAAPAASENFVITQDAARGSAYDVVLYKEDLSSHSISLTAVADLVVMFEDPISMSAKDTIVVTWTNTNTRTYGLELFYGRARG